MRVLSPLTTARPTIRREFIEVYVTGSSLDTLEAFAANMNCTKAQAAALMIAEAGRRIREVQEEEHRATRRVQVEAEVGS